MTAAPERQVDTTPHATPEGWLLDLLHPDGVARRVAGLGCHSPSAIAPLGDAGHHDEYDAILVAPDIGECRSRGWLPYAATAVGQQLAADGVVYVIAPRWWRTHLLRLLAAHDLTETTPHIHVRYGSSTEYVARCDAHALNQLVRSLPLGRSRQRILRVAVGGMPAPAACLGFAARRSGVAVRRRGARSLFAWATAGLDGDAHVDLTRIKTRGATATAAAWIFRTGCPVPCFVVKTALNDAAAARIHAERHALDQLGPAATHAGATLPTSELLPRGARSVRARCLDGVPADAALAAQPARLDELLRRIASWLARWNASTRCIHIADTSWLIREVLAPARSLASVLDRPEPYFGWLAGACGRAWGRPLPLVASHGDLTMSNIIVDGRQPFCVVDWESARESGLPLADFYYAAGDALAATGRYRSRAQALVRSVDADSEYGRWVGGLAAGIDGAFVREREMSRFVLHATALQHAADEQAKDRAGAGPFAELVRWLAARATGAGGHTCM